MRYRYSIWAIVFFFVGACQGFIGTSTYISNNTKYELRVEVRQYGYQTLQLGEYYKLYEEVIAPWQRARVLKMHRFPPLKPFGKARYNFDLHVTPYLNGKRVGRPFKLEQWLDKNAVAGVAASISPGVSGDHTPGLKETNWNFLRPVQVHVQTYRKLDKLGTQSLFDDIEFAFLPSDYEGAIFDRDERSLRVLTYNVIALPKIVFCLDKQRKRLCGIPYLIRGMMKDYLPDVVVFQEVFEKSALQGLIDNMAAIGYRHHSNLLNVDYDKPGSQILELYESFTGLFQGEQEIPTMSNGGVIIFSRHPIVKEDDMLFSACAGTDCASGKGVKYAEIQKGTKRYHIFGTHINLSTGPQGTTHIDQYKEFRAFVDRQHIPKREPIIIAGDFNEDLGVPKSVKARHLGPGKHLTNPKAIEDIRKGAVDTYIMFDAHRNMLELLDVENPSDFSGNKMLTVDCVRNAIKQKSFEAMAADYKYGSVIDFVGYHKGHLVPRACSTKVFHPKFKEPWVKHESLFGKLPDFLVRAAIEKAILFKGQETTKKPLHNPRFAHRWEPSDHQPVLGYFDFSNYR